jgi:uncharacterized protein YbjT (DUF2867 family)
MSNNKPKILVMGATGKVGKGVIPLLTANSNIEVIAAARSPETAKNLGVQVVYLDLDEPETVAQALNGVERVFIDGMIFRSAEKRLLAKASLRWVRVSNTVIGMFVSS